MVTASAISTASPFPSDLPPLSPRDAELLASLLDLRFNLTALAARHSLPALDLIHWASSPSIRSYIRALREVTDDCTRLRQSQARRSAIDTLETIAVTAEDPIEKRRAASSLLRSDQPRRIPRTTPPQPADPLAALHPVTYRNAPRADGLPEETVLPDEYFAGCERTAVDPESWTPNRTYKPVSTAHPSPAYSAEELVSRCVYDLQYHADTHQAAANLFPFLIPGAPVFQAPTPADPIAFLRKHRHTYLFEIVNASHHEVCEASLSETAAVYTVSLLSGINTLCPGLRFQLERSPSGPHADCWLITRIDQENVPWRQSLPEVPPAVRYDPAAPPRPP